MNYSRKDEYELDRLRSLVASGQLLSDSDMMKHTELEHKYLLFIEESQKQLQEKAAFAAPNSFNTLSKLRIIFANRKDRLMSCCTKNFRWAMIFGATTLRFSKMVFFLTLILQCSGIWVISSIETEEQMDNCIFYSYLSVVKKTKVLLALVFLLLRFAFAFRYKHNYSNIFIVFILILSFVIFLLSLFSLLSAHKCGVLQYETQPLRKQLKLLYYIDLLGLFCCLEFYGPSRDLM